MEDIDILIRIGARIRYFRTAKHYTQEQLADLAEIHNTYIGQVERGEKCISIKLLNKILTALEVSYTEFFEGIDIQAYDHSPARECYDIICEKPLKQQKHILHIIREIEKLSD